MRHDDQVRAELQAQYESLTAHIAAVDRDLGNELDGERRLVLQGKRGELDAERSRVVNQMQMFSASLSAASITKGKQAVEYDELTRLMYEIRSDVAVLKRQFDDHLARCGLESATFPPHMLTLLTVGGVVTLFLMVFIVIKIGIPG